MLQFTVKLIDFVEHLQYVIPVTSDSSFIQMTKYVRFHIVADNIAALVMTASDKENSIALSLSVTEGSAGEVCIHGKDVLEYCGKLLKKYTYITVTQQENNEIHLTAGKSLRIFPGLAGNLFLPLQYTPPSSNYITVQSSHLKQCILAVVHCIADEGASIALQGARIEYRDSILTFVGTNTAKFCHTQCPCVFIDTMTPTITNDNSSLWNLSISKRSLTVIKNTFCQDEEQTICVYIHENIMYWTTPKIMFCCQILDSQFPDYRFLLNMLRSKHATISREALLISLAIAATSIDDSKLLKLHFEQDKIIFHGTSQKGTCTETLAIVYNNTEINLGINAKYFSDIVQVIQQEEICIQMESENLPILIQEQRQDSTITIHHVLMPMRLK